MIRRGRGTTSRALANKLPSTDDEKENAAVEVVFYDPTTITREFWSATRYNVFPITYNPSENGRDSEVLPQHLVMRTRSANMFIIIILYFI